MQELIVGGDFESPGISNASNFQIFGSYGSWTGTEIEIGRENLFLNTGDTTNLVLELDGNRNETSVAEQTFTVTGDNKSATLSFDIAARQTGSGGPFDDPVLVEVLDSNNNVIFTQTVTPTSDGSFTRVEFNFDFGAEGDYTLRFTEGGDDNSLGSILDNISLMVCFAAGTRIKTPRGDVNVEDLRVGDLVSTLEGEAKPIRWIGSRTLDRFDLLANPNMRPVLIRQGALGQGMPNHDLKVSPQHRLMLRSKVAQRVLGDAEALVPAKKLTHLPDIDVQADCTEVQYFHFVLEEHSIVIAEHAYTESLYTGSEALKMLGPDALEELAFLFPDLAVTQPTPARPLHSRGKLIEKMCLRLVQNQKPAVELAQ